jgi:hypothetical protein
MQPKKKTSPILWVALIGIGVAAYVLTEPDATSKKSTTTRNNNRSRTVVASLITEEDRTAKRTDFKPVNTQAKNAFMPVIRKASAELSGVPNSLPIAFTGGESGWTYTGTASVDGRIQAVVENKATGQGDFLSVGQNWKNARVAAVTESTLVLVGMNGEEITVKMQESLGSGTSIMAGGFAPVQVRPGAGLSGPIGPVAVRPTNPPAGAMASEGESNGN